VIHYVKALKTCVTSGASIKVPSAFILEAFWHSRFWSLRNHLHHRQSECRQPSKSWPVTWNMNQDPSPTPLRPAMLKACGYVE